MIDGGTAHHLKRPLKSREILTVSANRRTNIRANFSPAFNNDGSISGVIGIFGDITERKVIEHDREPLIGELQHAPTKARKLSGFLPICSS